MKKILLFTALLTIGFTTANTQSFEITPNDGFLKSASPDLELTGSGAPQVRGKRSGGSLTSPYEVSTNSVLLDLIGAGYNGSYFADRASISMRASQFWTGAANGTHIRFSTTANGTTSLQERMRLTSGGSLGLNTTNPNVPFHINYSNSTSNSTTGTAIFGDLTNRHLNFNRFGIDSYNGTSPTALFLNSTSSGAVIAGGLFSPSDFQVTGFTQLGTESNVPKIKMKELSGITSSVVGGQTRIAHGISGGDKILAVDIIVEADTTISHRDYIPPSYTHFDDYEFNFNISDFQIFVRNKPGNSANILGKPIRILITYKE